MFKIREISAIENLGTKGAENSNLHKEKITMNKNFKVLFIYPNVMMENLIPPSISILSACLKKEGFQVKLFDTTYYKTEDKSGDEIRIEHLQIRDFDLSKYGINYKETDIFEDLKNMVDSYGPDLLAITAVEDTYKLGISLLKSVKSYNIPTIVGGVHPTFSPDEVISEDCVDVICIGEGEEALVELCEKMCNDEDYTTVKNLWVKKDGKIHKNGLRSLVDINKLPFPDFSIFEKERFYRPMQGRIFRMAPFEASRGCPFSCTYCAAASLRVLYEGMGSYLRIKNVERLIEEIKYQKKKYDLQYVYFTSETFLATSDEHFQKFVDMYKEINLPFWIQTRPETITEERVRLLEKINCNRITIGIESGNEKFRKEVLNRMVSNDGIIKALKILEKSSIPVSVNNIIGAPDETREQIFDTINLNRKIKADSISVFIFTPYRGTKLREVCLEKKYISKDDFSANLRKKSILKMPQLKSEEIYGLLRTFPLYVKFPETRFDEIKVAERFDEEGNKMFEKLSKEYREKYFI
jgi:radical SAM superfamily enzyme YgiQ (UPF0313 family)